MPLSIHPRLNLCRICAVLFVMGALPLLPAQPTGETLEATLLAWVDVKKTLSQEQAAWEAESVILKDLLGLLEQEAAVLQERLEALAQDRQTQDQARVALVEQRDQLRGASAWLEERLPAYEARVRALYGRFPEPLQERLEPLFRRLPEADADAATALSASQRLLTVLGLISGASQFNDNLTLVTELRPGAEAGAQVEVRTLYYGLAGAFYSDRVGALAGRGTPSAEGWQWEPLGPEDGPAVAALIAVYENRREAELIPAPLSLP